MERPGRAGHDVELQDHQRGQPLDSNHGQNVDGNDIDGRSGWKNAFLGDYDWSFLCTPRLPFCSDAPTKIAPFYSKDDEISILLALVMGLQHALAMVGGIITAPLLVATVAGFSPAVEAYVVSASLIVCSFASMIQILQIRIPFTKYVLGSGLLSVMGVSFAYIPVAQQVIISLRSCSCNGSPCLVGTTCSSCTTPIEGNCMTGEEAYGSILGTILVVCWFQTALSFCSPKILRRIFPPVVTGTCLLLIGVSLVATGFELWGGGQRCGSQVLTSKELCTGNGDVALPFGHRFYLGLGLVVFFAFILIELIGSPFMRNIQVIIALAIAMVIASVAQYSKCTENCSTPDCQQTCYGVLPLGVSYNNLTNTISGIPSGSFANNTICTQQCGVPVCSGYTCQSLRYVTGDKIAAAEWITFLWTHTFPLKVYAPAILPLLFASLVCATECIGDVTATTEASGLEPYGPEYERSIQGGLLADGFNTFLAALATAMPLTTYAQNNGVISLSRCAARRAGYACCLWLFLLGVIGKFAAVFITIPDCILGAITACLVASVVISGIHVMNLREGLTRRNRFISTLGIGIGLGVSLVPTWVNISGQSSYPLQGNFWPVNPSWSPAYRGFRDALILFISNGFSIGGFTALFLNLILPYDKDDDHKGNSHNTKK